MGDKKAIVYSAEWCPWCHKAIDFLKEKNVEVEIKDVGENPEYAKEVQEKSGQSGIPVILIGDEVIIGFNQPALKKALGLDEEKKEESTEKKEEGSSPGEEKIKVETPNAEEKKEEEKSEKGEEKSEKKKEGDTSYV
jgi:glutaredoxin